MTSYIIIDKSGKVNEKTSKNLIIDDLYKKSGFRKNIGFNNIHTWNLNFDKTNYNIKLYGKTTGKNNLINNYDFPPPIDSMLLYGNLCIVSVDNDNNILSLSLNLWNSIYNHLFKGFEDITDESESENELENIPQDFKTKNGYLKNNFIVDSDSDSNLEDINSELSEEEYEYLD